MKIILTSDGISSKSIEDKLVDLLDGDISAIRSCIITTASSKKDKSASALKTKELFHALGFACADFYDVEFEDPQGLRDYDVIYINGGNPFYLMLQLKRRQAVDLFRQLAEEGKVIVGTSAGAMVLADTIAHVNELNVICGYEPMDLDELDGYDAVGLTEVTILPHYNRFIAADPAFEGELQKLEKSRNVTFERVSDGEAVVINGDTMSFVRPGSSHGNMNV